MPNIVLSTCTRTSCKCFSYDKPIWVSFTSVNLFMFLNLLGALGFEIQSNIHFYGWEFMDVETQPTWVYVLYINFLCFAELFDNWFSIFCSPFYWALLSDKLKHFVSNFSTGTERSLQILWEGAGAEHTLWIIAITNIGTPVNSSMEVGASSSATCHALRCCSTHQSCQRSSESWSCWD